MGGSGKSRMPPVPRRRGNSKERQEHQQQGAAADISTPFDLAKKLRGAVQAKDMKALAKLFQRSEVAEMDDRSVAFVVRTAVEQHNSSALALLFSQPAVQAMGARAIAGLLQTAIRYKNVTAVLQLSKLEAAHDINTAYLSYLMKEAMALGHPGAVQALSTLQGHQTELEQLVPAGSFAGALRTAVLQGRRQMVYHMTQNDDVQTMEPGIMAGILGTAIYHRSGVIMRYLCWISAAQRLPAGSVADLLEAALQVGDSQAFGYICEELPGVSQLQGGHMMKLLLAAMRQPDTTVLCRLCQLPTAQALDAADTGSLLETALTDTAVCSVADTVCALCELLPGARALPADRLQQLLRAALPQQHSDSSTVAYLCSLPAALELRKQAEATGSQVDVPSAAVLLFPLTAAGGSHERGEGVPGSGVHSRSSSPSSGGRLGRASSSSGSSSSSSPVSRRSSHRSDCSSSDRGSVRKSGGGARVGVGVGALCQQLSGIKLLQPEALEELLLPC